MADLSKYFTGVAVKRLSEVEIRAEKSRQHEFNGSLSFRKIFGTERQVFQTRFIYLSDDEERIIEDQGTLTWYDSRENVAHRSAEYRFYYSKNNVTPIAKEGDLLLIARRDPSLLTIICDSGSTAEQQLLWLFGLSDVSDKFKLKSLDEERIDVGFAARYIIESIGIEIEEEPKEDFLDKMLKAFPTGFPRTATFSEFARATLNGISPKDDPDGAIIAWMEREEMLFKIFEKHIIEDKLKTGFGDSGKDNVEDFIEFSMSVHQRRKSRAGWAFDNHLAAIFDSYDIQYSRQKKTERNKPDYIFPGIQSYHDKEFPIGLLTMLGLKTTAKDRWRQILPEADKIWPKHLITLEPSISKNQTDEMREKKVQLVLPSALFATYSTSQQEQIISLSHFIDIVLERQSKTPLKTYSNH